MKITLSIDPIGDRDTVLQSNGEATLNEAYARLDASFARLEPAVMGDRNSPRGYRRIALLIAAVCATVSLA